MEAKDMLLKLRTERGLSQNALAEKLFVTRQAVSRWERGDTLPNTETLKLLSKLYDVSINTLLGSPRTLICQCCGMQISRFTSSKPSKFAFASDEKSIRQPTTSFVRCYLKFHPTRANPPDSKYPRRGSSAGRHPKKQNPYNKDASR